MAKTMEEKRIAEEEKRKYLELNGLTLRTCNDQDLENIKFNIEYALKKKKG